MTPATIGTGRYVGQALDRVDGASKVRGRARYTGETPLANTAYAVAVQSTIALGYVEAIDTSATERAPGVLDVITWENAPRLKPLPEGSPVRSGQSHLVLQDNRVLYYGQYLALVVAEELEQAEHAATLLRIRYAAEQPAVSLETSLSEAVVPRAVLLINPPPVDSSRGNPAAALEGAPVRLDLTYTTPVETHNPMEPHATVATWDGDTLVLFETTQWVMGARTMVAAHLGLPIDKVRVVSPFVGGGFGAKGVPWPHMTLAAIATGRVGRPVKLVLSRQQMFGQTGHRPATFQRLSLGADRNGNLIALTHDTVSDTSRFDDFVEAAGQATRVAYKCPNLSTSHRIVRVDVNTPSPMRGPGEASGSFAVESTMDELAYAVGLDPLELRLRNYAETDEDTGKPFSSKALRECYVQAAERFGWARRPRQPRSMRDGHILVGWGMATAIFPVKLSPASARIQLYPDGTAIAASATHELGTGTYTVLAQVAADALGLPLDRMRLVLGDTILPNAPSSAGSQTAASVGSAVLLAAREARQKVLELAVVDPQSPCFGLDPSQVTIEAGYLVAIQDPARREPWERPLQREPRFNDRTPLEVSARWTPPDRAERNWSGWSFGAHFCEVRIDEDLGEIRVSRWTGGFAGGRILNAKTAHSQIMGGIVWGIGQALHEHTVYDPRTGIIVNDDLADYHLPVNADVPTIEAFFIDELDTLINPLGVKGLGEIGISGSAAAIANAVYHATGVRIRDLPITLDKVLSPT